MSLDGHRFEVSIWMKTCKNLELVPGMVQTIIFYNVWKSEDKTLSRGKAEKALHFCLAPMSGKGS